MATVIEECSIEGQRSVVRLFNAKDIHKEMCPVYGGKFVAQSGSQMGGEILSRTFGIG
jgi:hypothetical protein